MNDETYMHELEKCTFRMKQLSGIFMLAHDCLEAGLVELMPIENDAPEVKLYLSFEQTFKKYFTTKSIFILGSYFPRILENIDNNEKIKMYHSCGKILKDYLERQICKIDRIHYHLIGSLVEYIHIIDSFFALSNDHRFANFRSNFKEIEPVSFTDFALDEAQIPGTSENPTVKL